MGPTAEDAALAKKVAEDLAKRTLRAVWYSDLSGHWRILDKIDGTKEELTSIIEMNGDTVDHRQFNFFTNPGGQDSLRFLTIAELTAQLKKLRRLYGC
jgi:hypothetical protein